MQLNTNIKLKIHNRFDIVSYDIRTGEIQKAQAENIVLDRMYSRLCTFATYFDQIVYGSGTGVPTTNRTTLFNRIGSKTATTYQLIRAYPTSQWTRTIRLGTSDNNGQVIREVGISDNGTNVNTHALITDSEGNPIELEKTEYKIIDIYATVFVTIWDVDWGLRFTGNGLRDYLTGSSMSSDQVSISFVGNGDDWTTITGTRTYNTAEKWVQTYARFNVEHHNKEVRYIYWNPVGLRCEVPRTGVFEGFTKTGVNLGVGDGEKTLFAIPNKNVKDITAYVDGVINTNWTYNGLGILFDSPVPEGYGVTADYTCTFIPKDADHLLDVTIKIQFGGTQPTPVMPEPEPVIAPGSQTPIGGNLNYGFFGEVSSEDLISGDDLCSLLGLTAGTSQNSNAGWLKFTINGKVLFVAKKTIRHSISWDAINAVGAVFGDRMLVINGIKYIIRLLSSSEWNALMYPIHVDHPSGAPDWYNYTNADILVASGNGRATWTSTSSGSSRVDRGGTSVSVSHDGTPSSSGSNFGFRPVLELL